MSDAQNVTHNGHNSDTMAAYYGRRAAEYEEIYHRPNPEIQQELSELSERILELFRDKNVLEIACGTGFWTRIASQSVDRITAIDISPEVIEIARSKGLNPERVRLQLCDAFMLENLGHDFDAGMACFWLSHVPYARLSGFLKNFHSKLQSGSVVLMADNFYIPGIGGKLIHDGISADTYKLRTIQDGSQHKILKNYFSSDELQEIFAPYASQLNVEMGSYYWQLSYRVK